MKNNKKDNPGVIAPPPLIYLGILAIGLLLNKAFPVYFLPSKLRPILGWSLIGFAVLCTLFAFRAMRRARTPVNVYKPSTAIVVDGPYRFTRNPLYLSLTLAYIGVAVLMNTLWAILLLPIALLIINRGVIDREERYLEQKFGEEYLQYKARVRRWI